ncbi:hypothetical protein [Limosilactobacillus vaginalis]|uniref:hypothetical protein n=1 Tax=Limosilactobacillus vaginalis TaxID=1633 RepID=UPI003F2150D8
MKKLQRSVFSGLLVLTLGFGLAGCGAKHESAKSTSSSKDKVAKVTKVKKSSSNNKKKQASSKKNANNESQSNNASSTSSAITNQKQSTNSANSNSSSSQKQLGLSDVAVWTDENGVTHHVDSDGMDRQTTAGSSSITYKDWSGSLPSNAQIVHQN